MNQLARSEPPRLAEPFRPVAIVVVLLAVMWTVEVIDLLPSTDLDRWGVRPRTVRGLFGVALAPFLHSGFAHLFANTIPFLVLGAVIAVGSITRFVQVSLIVGLASGLGTWLFATSGGVHIGASGLVFGYLTYLVVRGFFARRLRWIIGGILVLMFYGGILWGLLPRPGVSWSGHVFGAIGGLLAAWFVHGPSVGGAGPVPPTLGSPRDRAGQ
jgi:membrane associated rhomboid family serine protease